MKHGSLFSGIGGFDLAAEWAGWQNIFHCEWNPFGQKVLKHYWPEAISYEDITKTNFSVHRGTIDVLTGGFPCQPYSSAGKRLGKEDSRHLWPSMLRAIREIQPKWVVGENVFGITNWNGGLVFNEVQADLEAEGYQVQAYVLPAVSVNAPHRRDRVWFVANTNHRLHQYQKQKIQSGRNTINTCSTNATHTSSQRLQRRQFNGAFNPKIKIRRQQPSGSATKRHQIENWQHWPTQSPVCSRNDGLSTRLDGITLPKHRKESLKAYGNAIVPQVAYQIFKAINEYDHPQRLSRRNINQRSRKTQSVRHYLP